MGVYKEMEQKGWLNYSDIYRAANSGVYGRMYKLINTFDPVTGQYAISSTEEMNAYLREAEMRNTDWFDALFSNNISQNHSVSITSGTEKSSFYASLSAMLDPGWYKQSEVKRYTANVNTTYNVQAHPTVSKKHPEPLALPSTPQMEKSVAVLISTHILMPSTLLEQWTRTLIILPIMLHSIFYMN